jgi:acyl dehydratase
MTFIDSLRGRVGETILRSNPFEVRQTEIDVFAAVTLDWDYMHNDPSWAAKESPWGGSTIAHGYYLVSLLMHFHSKVGFPMVEGNGERVINYGIDRVRFIEPVRIGDQISADIELLGVKNKGPGRDLVNTRTTYYTPRCAREPHMIADILIMCVSDLNPDSDDRS